MVTVRFDVFLSHAWGDHLNCERVAQRPQRAGVERLRDALRASGLRVFYDDGSIDEFAPLADTIIEALSASKVMVSWCSELYLSRPACASELTMAMTWTVGQREPRVLVVNTEASVDHLPLPLRASLIPSAPMPDDDAGIADLVDKIAARCEAVDDGVGEMADRSPVEWFPERIPSSTRFTGRFRELWDLHGILTSSALQSGKDARGGAVVSGMGGSGKSLLAVEYAHRFGAAWPGGVVWLVGYGFDRDDPDDPVSSAEHAANALRSLASRLGIDGVGTMDLGGVRAAIQAWSRGRGKVLWIVDDLADEADTDAWAAPMEAAATIFTTRVNTYDGLFAPLHLDELSPDDALQLLTRDHLPVAAEQREAATVITERLGRHALALDVTRCRVRSPDDYTMVLECIDERSVETLERAGNRVGQLAVGHNASISATLQSSIDDLAEYGRKVLDIGACFDSLPLPDDTLIGIVAAIDDEDRFDAEDDTLDGIADLDKHSLARRVGTTTTIHRLVIDLARPASQLDPSVVVAAADTALTEALDDIDDERALRRCRAHYELGATLPVDIRSKLPDWLTRYESAVGNLAAAIRRSVALVEQRSAVLGPDHPDTQRSRNNLALAYQSVGDLARAIEQNERGLADSERVLGPDHPNTLTSRNNLANAYHSVGDLARAIELHERNLADYERVLGPDHPDTLSSRNNLAEAYHSVGDLARAIELNERGLADRERVLGPDHPDTLTSRNNLALAYQSVGDLARAIELHERTLADHERVLGPDHPNTLTSRNNLAEAYHSVGDLARAIELFERGLADRERVLGPDHPNTLTSRSNLAVAYLSVGDLPRAIELFERTLADYERVLGPDHPHTLEVRGCLEQINSQR